MEQLRQQQAWERSRWVAWWTVRVQSAKDVALKDLIEFPWEKSNKPVEIPSDDDVKRILERDKMMMNG